MKQKIAILIAIVSLLAVLMIAVFTSWKISLAGLALNILQFYHPAYSLLVRTQRFVWGHIPAFREAVKMGQNLKPIVALLEAQERKYSDYLSVRVVELAFDVKQGEARVTFELSNKLVWDLSLIEFKGSSILKSDDWISEDLRLTKLISAYQFEKCKDSQIEATFSLKSRVVDYLEEIRDSRIKACWSFKLECRLQFSVGRKEVWTPEEILFEEVPRIGNDC